LDLFLGKIVDDLLLLLLNDFLCLRTKPNLLLKKLAVGYKPFTRVKFLLEGVRSVSELLLSGLNTCLFGIISLLDSFFLSKDPLIVSHEIVLDFEFPFGLKELLSELILFGVMSLEIFLKLSDVCVKLVKLLLDVFPLVLGFIKLLPHTLNLSLLHFDVRLQGV
jgi:hypothetical protein